MPAVLPWGLSDLVVSAPAWILARALTPLLTDLKQLPLPEGGRRLVVLPVSVLPSLQNTQLPNWKLSFPASLANSFRQVTISICRQERYKLLPPLLIPRKLLIQGFLSSPFPQARLWTF